MNTVKQISGMLRHYPDVMSVAEVQRILSIGRTNMYALLQSGEIRSLRIGRTYRIPKPYLIQYIKDHSHERGGK